MEEEICYKNLAHVIIEAKKPRDLLCVRQRLREAGGLIQSESQGSLRTSGVSGVDSIWGLRA